MVIGGVNTLPVFADSFLMSNVEILGRPKYRPTKSVDRTEQSLTEQRIRNLSERNKNNEHRPIDLVYERDWWWCEDV
jgi:hypothetical protein